MLAFAGTAAESPVRYGLFLALPVLEISLGLWVLCDVRASLSSAVAGLCFLTFAAVSLGKAIGGERECGCFGAVRLSPWISLLLDMGCAVALLGPRFTSLRKRFGGTSQAGQLCVLSAAILGFLLMVPSGRMLLGPTGYAVIEPEQWIGQRLPILEEIDIAADLSRGEWIIVLYRNDCPRCHDLLDRIARLADDGAPELAHVRLAAVEMPSSTGGVTANSLRRRRICAGRLNDARSWFAETPLAIRLVDGRVAADDTPAVSIILGRQMAEAAEDESSTSAEQRRTALMPGDRSAVNGGTGAACRTVEIEEIRLTRRAVS